MKIEEVAKVMYDIQSISSKQGKQEVLSKYKDDSDLLLMLDVLFNPFIVTGLAAKKIKKEVAEEPNQEIKTFTEALKYVSKFNTGSNQDIANIQGYLDTLHEDVRKFAVSVLTKTFKCGMTGKSINKALGQTLIPIFGCQLAHPYDKYEHKVSSEFALTKKLDGHRCITIVENGVATFYTRKGHKISGLVELEQDISAALSNKSVVLDGEIVIEDDSISEKDTFQATGKVLKKLGDKVGLHYHVFDIVPVDSFLYGEEGSGKFPPYRQRRAIMEDKIVGMKHITVVPTLYIGGDKNKIMEYSDYATSQGWEGIMLNNMDAPYQNKRTFDLLKVKVFKNADVKVVDIYEGRELTDFEGMLGGVIIQFKDFQTDVGSGFELADREYYWKHPEEIIGKIIDVRYFAETTNQNGGKGLKWATFKGVRHDKDESDISYE